MRRRRILRITLGGQRPGERRRGRNAAPDGSAVCRPTGRASHSYGRIIAKLLGAPGWAAEHSNAPRCWPVLATSVMLDVMSDVTRILSAIEQGDPSAAGQLLPLVYDELRLLAA